MKNGSTASCVLIHLEKHRKVIDRSLGKPSDTPARRAKKSHLPIIPARVGTLESICLLESKIVVARGAEVAWLGPNMPGARECLMPRSVISARPNSYPLKTVVTDCSYRRVRGNPSSRTLYALFHCPPAVCAVSRCSIPYNLVSLIYASTSSLLIKK